MTYGVPEREARGQWRPALAESAERERKESMGESVGMLKAKSSMSTEGLEKEVVAREKKSMPTAKLRVSGEGEED